MRPAHLLLVLLAATACGDSSDDATSSSAGGAGSTGTGTAASTASTAESASSTAGTGGAPAGTGSGGDSGTGTGGGDVGCPDPILILEGTSFGGIATDGTHLYVARLPADEPQEVLVVPLAGGEPESIRATDEIVALTANASGVYWIEHDADANDRSLRTWSPAEREVVRLAEVYGLTLGIGEGYAVVANALGGSAFVASVDVSSGEVVDLGTRPGVTYARQPGIIDGQVRWGTSTNDTWTVWSADPQVLDSLEAGPTGAGQIVGFGIGETDAYALVSDVGELALLRVPASGDDEVLWTGSGLGGDVVVDAERVVWATDQGLHGASLDGSGATLLSDCWTEVRALLQTDDRVLIAVQGGDPDALRVYAMEK